MARLGTKLFTGQSGKSYLFNVYKGNMRFNDFIPGVYFITSETDGNEKAIFLGESDNVDLKLQNHELQSSFDEHEYNRISFHKNASREVREAIIEDLLPVLEPICT